MLKLPLELTLRFGSQVAGVNFAPMAPYSIRVPQRSTKGLKLQYQLRDDTGVKFSLKGADARGNDVDLGTTDITVTASDPKILTATYADGTLTVEPVGPLGTAQVAIKATLVDSTVVSGELDVTVVGGTPVNFNFEGAQTFPITPAPNAPTT